MTADTAWAPLARTSRDALGLLGHPILPECLPGEGAPCGGTFAEHAAAHLATLQAVITHHLEHLQPPEDMMRAVREHEYEQILARCRGALASWRDDTLGAIGRDALNGQAAEDRP